MPSVLVVDDCPDTTSSLCALLRLWGYEARAAGDGPSALRQAAESPPDAVLLDLSMPGMDGHEVASRLRAMPGLRDVAIIALSGHGRGRRAPVGDLDLYLVKPADPPELERLLATWACPLLPC